MTVKYVGTGVSAHNPNDIQDDDSSLRGELPATIPTEVPSQDGGQDDRSTPDERASPVQREREREPSLSRESPIQRESPVPREPQLSRSEREAARLRENPREIEPMDREDGDLSVRRSVMFCPLIYNCILGRS